MFSIKKLINLNFSIGTLKRSWNPYMGLYLYGLRKKICIYDFEYLCFFLRKVLNFISMIVRKKGFIYSYASKENGKGLITKYFSLNSRYNNCYYWADSYVGGLSSNYKELFIKGKQKIERKYDTNIGEVSVLPDVAITLDVDKFYFLIMESKLMQIPCVGLIDTDLSFFDCSYPIFGNNDALRIHFFLFHIFFRVVYISDVKENFFLLKELKYGKSL